VANVTLDVPVRYRRSGYDLVPDDERLALSLDERGWPQVAWLENAGSLVHVTPLTPALGRAAPDAVLAGYEVAGLVASAGGAMLLVRRDDPGTPLADPAAHGQLATAAVLVGLRQGTEVFASALTGTSSITLPSEPGAFDCAPGLRGALSSDGARLGAYFTVHGCEGDPHASFYGDKLVFTDLQGGWLSGGWDWRCGIAMGMRLQAAAGDFAALCLSDGVPLSRLSVLASGVDAVQLATEKGGIGYSAGNLGGMARGGDGSYFVAWSSRGTVGTGTATTTERAAHDLALVHLSAARTVEGERQWLTDTPDVDEVNVHLAPYGATRLLLLWDEVTELDCHTTSCLGTYGGTYARLLDLTGQPVTEPERLPAPPNADDELQLSAEGDLLWAFAADPARSYASPITKDASGIPQLPEVTELSVARLKLCE